jgi:hypothetical protein
MPSSRPVRLCVLVCLAAVILLPAQNAQPLAPNSDPTYQQLRNITLSGEAVTINNLVLKRDAATFHLRSGTLCFVSPVQGKVTGAVFVGDGNLVLDPPEPGENQTLKLLTKEDEYVENFNHLVFRFTDNSYDEIKKAGTPASNGCDAGLLQDSQHALRKRLRYNLTARILQDVLSPEPSGLFIAFIDGKKYCDKTLFAIDPHGAPPLAIEIYRDIPIALSLSPEEIELMTYSDSKFGYWASFHLAGEYKRGTPSSSEKNTFLRIEHQQLDTTIEKNANLNGKATTTFVSRVNNLRVASFDLFSRLRVQSVTDEHGVPLSFIQEDKNEDYQFSVILPRALNAGEKFKSITAYAGKEAVLNEGNGNYYVNGAARENWYPNNFGAAFGEYTSYDMTFRVPKKMKIAATGELVSENRDGGESVTVWKSGPQTVAGFNFGDFKMQEAGLEKPEYLVQSYANEEPPDAIKNLLHVVNHDLPTQGSHMGYGVALGNMSTTPLIKKALAEGELSLQLYSDYFGPIPYKRIAITQQTACGYGQAWPGLVWIPMCYFYDTTIRHQLGLDFGDRGYWKSVTSHEVAHQWWGHTVGFNSYRDQWMSEGFAELSASLYLQMIEKNPKKFIDFWNDQRELLLERDKEGWRAVDAGPVTMGYRMSNTRTGESITRRLIYPKGAYILHMIRMMMWDGRTGDQNFKAAMQDFVTTYTNQAASTEDFKATLEKHMTREMDLEGNHKMDWFFNEYVYGTALPTYKLRHSFEKDAAGDVVFNFTLTQSNVDENFRMLVPIYVETADGRITHLGRARVTGNNSIEERIPLKGLKDTPKRALLNY